MGIEDFAKKTIRAAVVGGTLLSGAAAADATVHKADAQTINQQSSGNNSSGNNSPNIISGGRVTINGIGSGGNPNVSSRSEGPINQESRRDNSPNVVTDDVTIIDGKVYFKKRQ